MPKANTIKSAPKTYGRKTSSRKATAPSLSPSPSNKSDELEAAPSPVLPPAKRTKLPSVKDSQLKDSSTAQDKTDIGTSTLGTETDLSSATSSPNSNVQADQDLKVKVLLGVLAQTKNIDWYELSIALGGGGEKEAASLVKGRGKAKGKAMAGKKQIEHANTGVNMSGVELRDFYNNTILPELKAGKFGALPCTPYSAGWTTIPALPPTPASLTPKRESTSKSVW